jgi:trimethylamine---corrinoid protein Co-methyltransferase
MQPARSPDPYDHFQQHRPVQLRSLSDDQIEVLHQASLEILERTGARFHAAQAMDLFRKAGAVVSDGNRVRIPAHLVEWALRSAPKNITIFNRKGRRVMSLGGYRSYYGVGTDAQWTFDLGTGERRKAVLQDMVDGVRLVDALPNLDFVMSQYLPSDLALEKYERAQMSVMLQESIKPIAFVGLEKASTIHAIEMASAVAGSLEDLAHYPFVINYVNFASPLNHNEESVERLLFAAERNLPSVYTPGRARGSEVPMTEAGAMALVNAGQLAGLVLAQLKREGSPFIWANPNGGALDMSTMVSLYASPDSGPTSWDVAHFYRLPIFGFAGAADAKVFDAQAAAEATLTLFENAINGANLVHDIGLLDSAMTGSLELVAFCDEVIGWLRQYLRRLEITENTLALDLVDEVGPDGSYLGTEHTVEHVLDGWRPALFDRWDYARWSEEGSLTLQERANRKVKDLIRDHRAEPLTPEVMKQLERIVAA